MATDAKQFMIEDAQIIFRNFAGKEGPFNREGSRNFSVIIPDQEHEKKLAEDHWNVKYLNPQEEGDAPVPYVPVEVSFKNRPPRVTMITSRSRTLLDEDSIEVLDYADILKVDLICNAYEWNVQGKTGVKAYLKTMFVTIDEDELERKYAEEK